MTNSNTSLNGSKETTVIVVDFKNKEIVAVLRNKSDDAVLAYLHHKNMSPKKLIVQADLTGDNVLMFSKVA